MQAMESINSTADDGADCALCGEPANGVEPRVETADGPLFAVPTCGECHGDKITECPRCERVIFTKDGRRVFVTPDLYCGPCERELNVAVADAALQADEQRDDFNEARR